MMGSELIATALAAKWRAEERADRLEAGLVDAVENMRAEAIDCVPHEYHHFIQAIIYSVDDKVVRNKFDPKDGKLIGELIGIFATAANMLSLDQSGYEYIHRGIVAVVTRLAEEK